MRIKALTSFAGPFGSFSEGEEGEVEHEVGKSWVKAGLAEEVKSPRPKSRAGARRSQGDELFGPED